MEHQGVGREGDFAGVGCIFLVQNCSLRLQILPPYRGLDADWLQRHPGWLTADAVAIANRDNNNVITGAELKTYALWQGAPVQNTRHLNIEQLLGSG